MKFRKFLNLIWRTTLNANFQFFICLLLPFLTAFTKDLWKKSVFITDIKSSHNFIKIWDLEYQAWRTLIWARITCYITVPLAIFDKFRQFKLFSFLHLSKSTAIKGSFSFFKKKPKLFHCQKFLDLSQIFVKM